VGWEARTFPARVEVFFLDIPLYRTSQKDLAHAFKFERGSWITDLFGEISALPKQLLAPSLFGLQETESHIPRS
jgi:hypothetical protein